MPGGPVAVNGPDCYRSAVAATSPGGDAATGRPPVRTTYLIKQVELAVRAELDRTVRHSGVTTLQYTALSVLHRSGPLSSAGLARRSFVSPQAANEMVGALERKGLVSRRPDPANRRILLIALTGQGLAVLAACDAEVDRLEQKLLAPMAPADATTLRRLLETCLASLR